MPVDDRTPLDVGGYWRGEAVARVLNADALGLEDDRVSATTRQTEWSETIHVSNKEHHRPADFWADVQIPSWAARDGQRLQVEVSLEVTYPEKVGDRYVNRQGQFQRTAEVILASPQAGARYQTLWWLGVLGATGFVLLGGLALLPAASAYKRQAHRAVMRPLREPREPEPEEDEPPSPPPAEGLWRE